MYTVYGRSNCAYCEKAKNLLTLKGLAFKYVDVLEKPENMEAMREASPGAKTVPQIVLDGKLIGGFTELEKSLMSA